MKKSNGVEETAPKSKFSLGGATVAAVKSGERTSNDTYAFVETASQMNKFRLNKMASELLGVVSGDRVKILITGMDGIDGKYLIAKAPSDDASSAKLLSPTKSEGHGSLLFNYAGIWSRIAQATADAEEKSGARLVEEGVAIARTQKGGTDTYYLNQKAIYSLVEVEDFTEDSPLVSGGISYPKVFALISPKTEEVDLTKEVPTRKSKDTEVSVEEAE